MASKKKESEGIALLSMYNDEDMDADDDEEGGEEEGDGSSGIRENDPMDEDDVPPKHPHASTPQMVQSQTPVPDDERELTSPLPPTPQTQSPPSPIPPPPPPPATASSEAQVMGIGAFGIVDYAHDETAMSPDAEEGEIVSVGNATFGRELQAVNGNFQERTTPGTVQILTPNIQATTPQSVEQLEQSNYEVNTTKEPASSESEEVQIDVVNTASVEMPQENIDPLERFLPPPPIASCPEELQKKINKFLDLKKKGISFNADLRNRKDYRNPDFLLHAVVYQDIDQIGTCFSKDVFDPHGYDKSDYYDEIEADLKREMERKEQEKKKNQKIDFVQGGSQPGVVPAAKTSTQIAASVGGFSAVATAGAPAVQPVVDAALRDSRQNKKTKWDKVDGDRRNPLNSRGQDTISAVSAHAALLSAANVGAGYTAFAQQKRREAEEKRSSERRLEKRS